MILNKLEYYQWYDMYQNRDKSFIGFFEYRVENFNLKEYQEYYKYPFSFIKKFVDIEYDLI
tara:strand:- start:350 stop:532 length:183 start_codon:yes stop_codon:yes gene_type:complete